MNELENNDSISWRNMLSLDELLSEMAERGIRLMRLENSELGTWGAAVEDTTWSQVGYVFAVNYDSSTAIEAIYRALEKLPEAREIAKTRPPMVYVDNRPPPSPSRRQVKPMSLDDIFGERKSDAKAE